MKLLKNVKKNYLKRRNKCGIGGWKKCRLLFQMVKEENMFGQWMGENRIVLENGFEDDDFEEKFLKWLNSKSEEEILEGMERIVRRAK